jgi:hypothetical protein
MMTAMRRSLLVLGGFVFLVAGASAASSPVRKLAVTPTLKRQLVAAFAPAHGVPVAEVGGTFPGSVFYAYDRATHTYWAVAFFEPARGDSAKVADTFQDAGSNGVFSRTASGAWKFHGGGAPISCTEARFVPKAVLTAWGMATRPSGCS